MDQIILMIYGRSNSNYGYLIFDLVMSKIRIMDIHNHGYHLFALLVSIIHKLDLEIYSLVGNIKMIW